MLGGEGGAGAGDNSGGDDGGKRVAPSKSLHPDGAPRGVCVPPKEKHEDLHT